MDHPVPAAASPSLQETAPATGFWPRLLSHLTFPGVRLETKIFVGFATVLLLLCAFGLFTLHNLSRVREEAATVERRDMPLLALAKRLQHASTDLLAATSRYSLTLDPADADAPAEKLALLQKEFAAAQTDPAVRGSAEVAARLAEFGKVLTAFAGTPPPANASAPADAAADPSDAAPNGDLAAFAAAIDGMRDERSTLEDTGDTFRQYLQKVAAQQQENLRARKDDPNLDAQRLALIDEILNQTESGARDTARGIAQQNSALITSAAQSFDTILDKMNHLLAITPATRQWTAAEGVGLARKDDLSNAQSQAQVYKSTLTNFLNSWKTMEAAKDQCDASVRSLQEVATHLAEDASLGATTRAGAAVRVVDVVRRITYVALPILIAAGLGLAFVLTRIIASSIESIVMGIARTLSRKTRETLVTADQLHQAGRRLADQAAQQAAEVEQTGASVVEFGAAARATTEKTRIARDLAAEARTAAENGGTEMAAMHTAVASVEQSGERLKHSMEALREFSHDISLVLKEIQAVAFQTRILALNASVEAARAGLHGKGFAIVASEVGSLAERSSEASRRSNERIALALQRVEEGSRIGEEVLKGVSAIRHTSSNVDGELHSILERVRNVDTVMQQIAASAEEQNSGLAQIDRAVRHLDQITQANAQAADETATAAGLLRHQAADVQQSVTDLVGMVRKSKNAAGPGLAAPSTQSTPDAPVEEPAPSASRSIPIRHSTSPVPQLNGRQNGHHGGSASNRSRPRVPVSV